MRHKIHHQVSIWAVFFAVAFGTTGFLLSDINKTFALSAPSIYLSPAGKNVSINDTFTVDIILDTGGVDIDGVDIVSLHYDKNMLEVQDSISGTSGVQISPGSLLALTLLNSVNTSTGTVQFSQLTSGGSHYNGSGKLASITFKALSGGTTPVSIDFTPGSTSDSNVAGNGVDKLASVGGGSYTLGSSSSSGSSGGGGGSSSSSKSSSKSSSSKSSSSSSSSTSTTPSISTEGCTSTTLYSPKTGAKCPNVSNSPGTTTVVYPTPASGSATSVVAGKIYFNSPLSLSNKNDVKNLQTVLNKALKVNLKVDGIYGPATLNAVKGFQNLNFLKADGVIGPLTRAKLNLVK